MDSSRSTPLSCGSQTAARSDTVRTSVTWPGACASARWRGQAEQARQQRRRGREVVPHRPVSSFVVVGPDYPELRRHLKAGSHLAGPPPRDAGKGEGVHRVHHREGQRGAGGDAERDFRAAEHHGDGARLHQAARRFRQRRVGFGDAPRLHRGDGRCHQPRHDGGRGLDHLDAALREAIGVEAHGERAFGGEQADRAGRHRLAREVDRGGVDDVQDRHRRDRVPHLREPAMGGVAGDADRAAAGGGEAAHAAQQGGKGIGRAGAAARGGAVGHARVGPEQGRHVVLVALRGKELREAHHELRAGQRPHAAEHAERAARHRRLAHRFRAAPAPAARMPHGARDGQLRGGRAVGGLPGLSASRCAPISAMTPRGRRP